MELFNYYQGVAGTGKSYKLRQLKEAAPTSTALCSTTGISAVNLGAGITINSLLWYFNSRSLMDNWTSGKLDFRLSEVYGKLGIRRILLDEISMLCQSDLSILCLAIDRLNETLIKDNKEPMGLTISGDFLQLPPIEGDFAFESEHWEKFENNTTILREIYRQEDKEFIDALHWVRCGDGKKAAEYFEDKMFPLGDPTYNGTSIYPYNSQVDRHNQYRLESVVGQKISFNAIKKNKQRPEWKYIPEKLELKLGALVMILANNYTAGEIEYCNGDLGTLVGKTRFKDEEVAVVKLQRNGMNVQVAPVLRDNVEIVKDKPATVGAIKYVPIRLAFASSVHKTQGLTMDAAQVDFRAKFFGETPGMLYVALSRCRAKAGLRLVGSPKTFVQRCKMNPKLVRFL